MATLILRMCPRWFEEPKCGSPKLVLSIGLCGKRMELDFLRLKNSGTSPHSLARPRRKKLYRPDRMGMARTIASLGFVTDFRT
jgi:hypothetical protein